MRKLAVVAGAVALMAVGGVALAQTTGNERIYACVNNGDGTMRQVAGPDVACSKGWHKLSWSAENPPATPIPTTTTYTRSLESTALPNTQPPAFGLMTATPMCDEGDVVVGGGIRIGTDRATEIFVSRPRIFANDPEGWTGGVVNKTDESQTFDVYARCQHTE